MKLINLAENVLLALDFFTAHKLPKLSLDDFHLPFVVGSGNAYNTGMVLFSGKAAIFADESNFKDLIASYAPVIKKGLIKQCLVISASGEKDSVWEVEYAKKKNLGTTLLTCNGNSSADKIADKTIVYQKIAEPYTYNVSTYLGMILSSTQEDPQQIKKFITNLALPKTYPGFTSYSFVLADKYLNICPMLEIKRDELFGPYLSLRAFSEGHARHAKFVHRSSKELVISLGLENKYFGHPQSRWNIELPQFASFGTVLALTYFLIGKIQQNKPPYFENDITAYCQDYGPKAYGSNKPFDVIVPAK
jgi:hypothetical protein